MSEDSKNRELKNCAQVFNQAAQSVDANSSLAPLNSPKLKEATDYSVWEINERLKTQPVSLVLPTTDRELLLPQLQMLQGTTCLTRASKQLTQRPNLTFSTLITSIIPPLSEDVERYKESVERGKDGAEAIEEVLNWNEAAQQLQALTHVPYGAQYHLASGLRGGDSFVPSAGIATAVIVIQLLVLKYQSLQKLFHTDK